MRIVNGSTLEKVGEKYIVFINGHDDRTTQVLMLNSSSAWLWQQMKERDFSREEALEALLGHFDTTREQAEADLDNWLRVLSENGILNYD